MASTTSPGLSRTDESSSGSRPVGDRQIATQRQPKSLPAPNKMDLRSEEARRHSEEAQAATDIAAGW